PAAGGIKRYALRPLAATRPVAAAFVFFFLLPAPLQSWRTRPCQGCACAPSAARPALDVAPPGLPCASCGGRKTPQQPAAACGCQGTDGRAARPPASPAGPLAAIAGALALLATRQHTARQ